jgi:hypothetical protein
MVCKIDSRGYSIPSRDLHFDDPSVATSISSDIKLEDVNKASKEAVQLTKESTDIASGAGSTLTGVAEFTRSVKKLGAFLGGTGAALSTTLGLLEIFGVIGGPSATDQIIDAIKIGIQQLERRIAVLQEIVRQGFLDITELISNVVLDEQASHLDSLTGAFSSYINATDQSRRSLYDPMLQALCNKPYETPKDIFYVSIASLWQVAKRYLPIYFTHILLLWDSSEPIWICLSKLYICSQEENDASQQYNSTEPIQ